MIMQTNRHLKKAIKKPSFRQGESTAKVRLSRAGLIAMFIMISGACFLGYFCLFAPKRGPSHLEFVIKPVSGQEKFLEICLTIRNPRTDSDIYSLYKGEMKPLDLYGENSRGDKLAIAETDDSIKIIVRKNNLVKLFYRVMIAQPGKHGYRGEYYDDLLTFDGEQTLLFPSVTVNGDDRAIKKDIGRITIKTILPPFWVAVVPFAEKGLFSRNGFVADLKNPNWAKIYDLAKSAYTFGKLTKYSCPGENLFSIYVDPSARQFYTDETMTGLKSIYEYYTKLFDYKIHYAVVLLRKDPINGQYLIGGSGAQTLATTFDPQNPRDWQLMGHRFFHAFFEHKMTSSKFHFPPQLWFYEGLATYYENMALSGLPGEVTRKLDLTLSHGFQELFRRYLYMRLKNPNLFAIAPMSEETIGSAGQIEFLHYTQAPLILKYMNDLSYLNTGIHDRVLKFILYNKPDDFNLQSVFGFVLGKKAPEFANQYLFRNDVLPLWYLADSPEDNQAEDPSRVIQELNDFEYTLWTWFRLEKPGYPKVQLTLDGLAGQAENAEKAGLRFASGDMEAQVKKTSPTVWRLLKQSTLHTSGN